MTREPHIKNLECPYCEFYKKWRNARKKPTAYGKFKVFVTTSNQMIFKCLKCNKRFKTRYFGSFLVEADMNMDEKTFGGKNGRS